MCCIERYWLGYWAECNKEEEGAVEKAQVSITWVPWVLMILMLCPALRWVAVPWRAGIVHSGEAIGVLVVLRGLLKY